MRVQCDVEEVTLEGDYDYSYSYDYDNSVDGVQVTCSRCGHYTESYGTEERSVSRSLALLREECPRGEKNFYLGG